jgi:hypothetical protein
MTLLLFRESHRQLMEQGFREVEPQRTDVIDKAALNSLLRVAIAAAWIVVASCPVLHNQNLQKVGDQILGIWVLIHQGWPNE